MFIVVLIYWLGGHVFETNGILIFPEPLYSHYSGWLLFIYPLYSSLSRAFFA